MGTVSYRKYIRWYPDEASEPTSTLVLTSPENRFVDLRILLPPNGGTKLSNEPTGKLPLDRLDWAIAGTTISEAATAPTTGEPIRRSTFRHWVSSRVIDPTGVSDVGDMYPQEDGTTLEKGAMANPATGGRVANYDELWTDLLAPTSDYIAVLRVDGVDGNGNGNGNGVKGMLVWIGALCQALVRDDKGITLERWEKLEGAALGAGGDGEEGEEEEEEVVDEGTWTRTVRMGTRELPCESVLTGKVTLEKDGVVACQGDMWQVVELLGGDK
ncbi:sodium/nucleoside cotransporter [Beauveria brongniartii RCEF 3172]|uniref:Protein HRI1 n=1 Tax=Beauveria brongniartii RCEF 3172 TaxID=1081107 RepID=A0A162M5Q0_9HYPO|nr:sodium/nucleoside cotransporter [Beauveria brongniartii RCEF 3172]